MINTMHYDFDAVVVGSGISGGWAAKELTEKGLKVLLLERGNDLQHGSGYRGEHAPMWKMSYNGKPDRELEARDYPVQSKIYAFSEANRQFWNNDRLNPYAIDESTPYDWVRGGVVGGRSLMWGRQSFRFSEQDFNANRDDKHAIPWPVSYKDIAPWYSYVEKFIGVNGQKENLPQLPDGEFQKPMPWYALEKTIKQRLAKKEPDITLTNGRAAILTEPKPGRSACHYCGPCERGCSTGSYFSTQSTTLPAAKATGNLTLKPNMVVERLHYDKTLKKITTVHAIDTTTNKRISFSARIFFLCASTVGSTQILLNSSSDIFPNGLANNSGALGHYLMDHFSKIGAVGIFSDHQDSYFYGYRPSGLYIPRFKNIGSQDKTLNFVRGYGYQTHVSRGNWMSSFNSKGFGADYKNKLRRPGLWTFFLAGFGECLPNYNNQLSLSKTQKDRYGIPQVVFNFKWGDNEHNMARDMQQQALKILHSAGAVQTIPMGDIVKLSTPGSTNHEMGSARMGDDPSQAVLNKYNQTHDVPNLFVTDGSFMTSSSCVNPSLTYMAFTARACDYAAQQLAAGTL